MKKSAQLQSVEPIKLAQQQTVLEGRLPISEMERVREAVFAAEGDAGTTAVAPQAGEVVYRLVFGFDENRQLICRGHLETRLVLECQRCLGAVDEDIESEFVWAFVSSDEGAAQLPKQYEPVLFDGTHADLVAVIEDEVLLAVPMYPVHASASCAEGFAAVAITPAEPEKSSTTTKPFAGLAELLKK